MLFGGHPDRARGRSLSRPRASAMLQLRARASEPEEIESALQKGAAAAAAWCSSDPAVLQAMEHSALEAPCYLPIAVKKDGARDGEPGFCRAARKARRDMSTSMLHEIARRGLRAATSTPTPTRARRSSRPAPTASSRRACHFENGRGSDRMEYIQATKTDEFWQYIDEMNGEGAHDDG